MNLLVSLLCNSNVRCDRYEWTHIHTYIHTHRITTIILAAETCQGLLELSQKYFALQVKKASKHHQHLCNITVSVGWEKLWDHSLDHGIMCYKPYEPIVRILTYQQHAARICPLCEDDDDLQFDALVEHIMAYHTSSGDSWDVLLNSLIELDPSCFRHLLCLYKLF